MAEKNMIFQTCIKPQCHMFSVLSDITDESSEGDTLRLKSLVRMKPELIKLFS